MIAATLKLGESTRTQLIACMEKGEWKHFDAIAAAFVRISLRLETEAPLPSGVSITDAAVIRNEVGKMNAFVSIIPDNSPIIDKKSGGNSPIIDNKSSGNSPEIDGESGDNSGQEARATKDDVRFGDNSQTPLPESPSVQELEDAFNDLWEVYPRKSGKGDAKRAFFRVVREEGVAPATIFYAVMEQSKSPDWTADDGKFVPSLTKWLDGGRWDDVLSAPQEKKMTAPTAQPDPYEYRGPLSPDEIWGDAAQRAAAVAAATGRTPTDV
jgi:hypothetical protein